MDAESLNSPRWPRVSKGSFHEAWFVSGSGAKAGYGLWLRYGVDLDSAGAPDSSIWGSWFERDASERTFVIKNMVDDATISRTGVAFGAAGLTASGCTGEVEAGGHSLRWRLSFGQGAPAEDVIPAWLSPIARLRLSGYVLPHAKTTLSGAVEVDGRMSELQRMPALQGHLWGRSYWPAWAWARCSGFTEDPEASVELLDVEDDVPPAKILKYLEQAEKNLDEALGHHDNVSRGQDMFTVSVDFHRAQRPVSTSSSVQVRRPLYRSSLQRWRRYEAFLEPFVSFARYLPASAFIPLLILWAGIGELQKLLVIFIGSVFQIILMIAVNVGNTRRDLVEAAYTLGASDSGIIRRVLLPSSAPEIAEILRLVLGWAWTYVIVAELIGSSSGIGHMITDSQALLNTGQIIFGIIVIGLIGLVSDFLFKAFNAWLFPWKLA